MVTSGSGSPAGVTVVAGQGRTPTMSIGRLEWTAGFLGVSCLNVRAHDAETRNAEASDVRGCRVPEIRGLLALQETLPRTADSLLFLLRLRCDLKTSTQ